MYKILAYSSLPIEAPPPDPPATTDNEADNNFISLWLGLFESPNTQDLYSRCIVECRQFIQKPLRLITVADLQGWLKSRPSLAPSSVNARITAVKSLFRLAVETGYLQFNPASVIRGRVNKQTRAERILSEDEVLALLQAPTSPRNRALLYLLYSAGLRVSEAVSLRWRDLQARDDGDVQITVFGKGGKTRVVLVPMVAARLLAPVSEAESDWFVFSTPRDPYKPLGRSMVHRIVKNVARAAGVNSNVSAHWMRHAHASHALAHGASLPLVQATLGHADISTTSVYLHIRPGESSGSHLRFPEPVSEADPA